MANVTKQFTTDPLKFLQSVPTTCPAEGVGLSVKHLKLDYDEDLNVAQMKTAGSEEERASFYVLGWAENDVSTGKLGSQADYFYTGPLTGCMFAVDKNWYTPRVVHVNEQLEDSSMNVKGMQSTIATEMKGATSWLRWMSTPNITVVESHQRKEGHRFAILGWRGKLGWTFVRQTVKTTGFAWSVVSVEKLDNWV